jgi:hypothetical protein
VKVDNRRLARRHIHSFLIQTFFHGLIDRLSREQERELARGRSNLFSALGRAGSFFGGQDDFSLRNFKAWLDKSVFGQDAAVADEIARWLPDELFGRVNGANARFARKREFAIETARKFLTRVEELAREFRLTQRAPAGGGSPVGGEEEDDTPMLLDVFFDRGLFPSYAFPTDLCSFYVFERDGRTVRIKERPQQSKDKALSEYAPGRLLVINKKTYRVGGIYEEGGNPAAPAAGLFAAPLDPYVYCEVCEYVRTSAPAEPGEQCPVCQTELRQHELLDPPGFSPENGMPVEERDREQEISYATTAQFPTPTTPDRFVWKTGAGVNLRHAYEEDRGLVVVNRGPDNAGFRICSRCGAAKPETESWPQHGHERPFQLSDFVMSGQRLGRHCVGPLHDQPVYLGHSFRTDLLLLRVPLRAPLSYGPRHRWLQDALRTTAEALSLGASRVLDVDPGELSAGYRLIPAASDEDQGALGVADFYLFDTASGGAGYAAEAGDMLPRVLDEVLRLLEHCPRRCENSCTECLRHYGNRYWQERLDRFLAKDMLTYARYGTAPVVAEIEKQAWQLRPLERYLQLEGWQSEENAVVSGRRVPLVIRSEEAADTFAVGTYPALLDRNAEQFGHPLHELDGEDDVKLILLNDFVVSRDLPSAYREFRRQAGFER